MVICPQCGAEMDFLAVGVGQPGHNAVLMCEGCDHTEPLPVHVVLELEGYPRLPGM